MPGSIHIRVLGPLEIDAGGSPVSVPGGRQGSLLALLAVRAGTVLSTDVLIDALWGEEPPPSARNALQVLVSTLRKVIGSDPSVRLETSGPGYVLRADPEALDLLRFEQLVADGDAALTAGEAEEGSELLRRALELWRGRPLEGIDLPGFPVAEIAELEERHARAVQLRLDAEIALGRHLEVLPELEGLLASRPLDERLSASAALARYRAGRQAEALEVLATLRHALSKELGIEPGPAIGQLEQRILEHDPTLDLTVPTAEGPPREARRMVTVLVGRLAALRGGERLDPESARAAFAPAVEAARAVIDAHGGTMGEVVGGRIAAIFGIPQVHEDDPVRAVRAAEELRSSSPRWPHPEGVRTELRCGVATGEVLVRDTGKERSLLSADPLEEADRLAKAARAGEVLLAHATGRLARQAVDAEPADIVLLGDEGEATSALRLVEVSADAGQGRRLSSPLVGRTHELAVLAQVHARVARERGSSLVTVLGPAGIGKTRLIAEFISSVRPGATVVIGRCLPYGRDITYWPVAEIVRAAAGIAPGDGPEVVSARLAEVLSDVPDADYVAEHLLAILGLAEVVARAEEVFWAVRTFLIALARPRPLVVVLDDVHWAEETLLDLIEYVVGSTRDAAVLVVCLARGDLLESRPTWGAGRLDATNLALGSLDGDESSRLLRNLLGQAELDAATHARILDAAEGHPLYLEELLAMLIDEEILSWQDGSWVLDRDLSAFPLPGTVHALLDARLDRLPAEERAALEHAAVIGRVVSEEDLRVLAEADVGDLEAALDGLIRRDLLEVERVSRAGRTIRFRHILLRNAVYEGMSKEARAKDHEDLGAHLERPVGEAGEIDEVVGYHLESAVRYRRDVGRPEEPALVTRAVERLAAAGRRAFGREDMPAATGFLERAIALLDSDDPRVPELSWRRAVGLLDMGRFAEANDELARGLEIAERIGDEPWSWRLRIERAEVGSWSDPRSKDSRHLEEVASAAIAALEPLGDRSGLARACRLMGDAFANRGRLADAEAWFTKAHAYAAEVGDERELWDKLTNGAAYGSMPADRCVELLSTRLGSVRHPDPDSLATLGLMLAMAGRSEEAGSTLERGLRHANDLGVEWKAANVLMHRGAALLIQEDAASAEATLRPAVESLQRMGERGLMSTAVALLAEALYRLGRDDDAMLATIASEGAAAEDDAASQMAWRGVRAKVLARRGDLREAERLAREAVGIADGTDMLNMAADAHRDLGIVLEAMREEEGARLEHVRSLELYEAKGNVATAAAARARLERLAAGSPAPSAATGP